MAAPVLPRSETCQFCRVVSGELAATLVWDDENAVVFLDHRPLFAGHCLVVPRGHWETINDVPAALVGPLFLLVRAVAAAVEIALEAKGTFIALNNRVSQSVPHLHVHVVPRRPKDGLKGFFWPRQKYKDDSEMAAVQAAVRRELLAFFRKPGNRDEQDGQDFG